MIPNWTVKHNFFPLQHPKIVIVGCGRSGTLYMSKVCQCFDRDVGHEGFGRDGISSWYLGDESRAILVRGLYQKCVVAYFHLVRHPIDVINSMYACELHPHRAGLDFYRRSTGHYFHPSLSSTAEWWIQWNAFLEYYYPESIRIRVEDISSKKVLQSFASRVSAELTDDIYQKIQDLGSQTHTIKTKDCYHRYTLEDIEREDFGVSKIVQKFGEKYGYSF